MQPNQNPGPDNDGDIDNPLAVMQPGEKVICQINRAPIGLIGTYLLSGIVVLTTAVLAILVPHFVSSISGQAQALLLGLFVFIALIALLFTYIAVTVYKGNRWIVTSDSLTQISQVGLFRKQASQLSLANLEDVTAEQNGMMQTMFHFGTLRVETAGERSKFLFPFCPNPNDFAQQILRAREDFIRNKPEQAERANEQLDVPPPPTQPNFTSNDPANGHGV